MIYAKIWTSEQFGKLSDKAKLLFIGSITLADDDGRLRGNPAYLRGQVFPYEENITVSEVLQLRNEVEKSGLIGLYSVDDCEYIQHPKWTDYQIIRKDLYKESTLPRRNESVTKPLRKRDTSQVKLSKDKISKYTEEDLELSKLLLEKIQANTPTFKEPNLDNWADHIRLMRETDNRTPKQIRFLIEWCQQDNFWQANILSTSKLREKFDTLVAQVKRKVGEKEIKKSKIAFT